jgi:hypothetical protein
MNELMKYEILFEEFGGALLRFAFCVSPFSVCVCFFVGGGGDTSLWFGLVWVGVVGGAVVVCTLSTLLSLSYTPTHRFTIHTHNKTNTK